MSAHTPGPWQIIRESQDAVITYSDGELRSHIARIYDTTLCPEHGTVDGNARLIAAAPRMYERIKRDVEQCGCNSLPVRPVKMPDGSVQIGCGYCKDKRAILRDVEGN